MIIFNQYIVKDMLMYIIIFILFPYLRLWTLVERQKMFAQENIYFTDCILRHMHQYRFIAHFDPDEVPILPKHENFLQFLDDIIGR